MHATRTLSDIREAAKLICELNAQATAKLHGTSYLVCTQNLDSAARYLAGFLASDDTSTYGKADGNWVKMEYMILIAKCEINKA